MLVLLLGVALAAPVEDKDTLWLEYLAHFEPEALPAEHAGRAVPDHADHDHPGACATHVVLRLDANRHLFTDAEWERIARRVHPMDFVEPRRNRAVRDTCWGQQEANRLTSEHFAVEWSTTKFNETKAQSFLDALEEGWQKQVAELGWREPDGMDDYLMWVGVDDGGASAYTTVANCDGRYVPYIVAGTGSFSSGNWYQDMAVHEFNHASQFAYGYAHEFWFWEATATYIQDDVYPTHEWWSTYVTGYTDNPWLALNAESQSDYETFYHMYGMCIWLFYLDEYVGGEDFARQLWESGAAQGGYYNINPKEAVEDAGYDFTEVYKGFITANTVMAYSQGDVMPSIDIHDDVDSLPASGESNRNDEPEKWGQNYIRIDGELATDDAPDLRVVFAGEDPEAEWMAVVVGAGRSQLDAIIDVPLADGAGEVTVADFGQYKELWLVVSPMANGDGNYTYTLEAVPASAPLDTGDTGTNAAEGDDERKGGVCGCDASSGAIAGLLPLLLGAGVMRRRRR